MATADVRCVKTQRASRALGDKSRGNMVVVGRGEYAVVSVEFGERRSYLWRGSSGLGDNGRGCLRRSLGGGLLRPASRFRAVVGAVVSILEGLPEVIGHDVRCAWRLGHPDFDPQTPPSPGQGPYGTGGRNMQRPARSEWGSAENIPWECEICIPPRAREMAIDGAKN